MNDLSMKPTRKTVNDLLESNAYNPGQLLDHLLDKCGLKNDAALCRKFDIKPPTLSKVRHRVLPINGDLLVRFYDLSGIEIDELREIAGIPKTEIHLPPKPIPRPQQAGA